MVLMQYIHIFSTKKQLNYGYCSKTLFLTVISLHVALVDLASHYIQVPQYIGSCCDFLLHFFLQSLLPYYHLLTINC